MVGAAAAAARRIRTETVAAVIKVAAAEAEAIGARADPAAAPAGKTTTRHHHHLRRHQLRLRSLARGLKVVPDRRADLDRRVDLVVAAADRDNGTRVGQVVRHKASRSPTGVRRVRAAAPAQAKVDDVATTTTIPRAPKVVPDRIGRTRPDRAAAQARLLAGMETTAEARTAGAGMIATTIAGETATTTAGVETVIAGAMRRIIHAGGHPTTTTAATGIRSGTTMAGMTAGAGTSR
jgi:hypothetical protein